MTATIYDDVDQGSPEWKALRAGIPTASMFATVMRAKGRGEDGDSKTRLKYVRQVAGEILSGEPMETYENAHMERGRIMEEEARSYYAVLSGEPLRRIAFARDDALRAGCSPDALVGERRVLEIKTALPDILIEYLLKNEFPPNHKAQCQGNLWLLERDVVDIEIYWPTMPAPFIKEAGRDEAFIRDLAAAVARFNEEVDEVVDRVRRYGMAPAEVVRGQLERSLA